ncbi:unnamed protein product [Lactuca virosa]|uniref:Protein kinase domain-containing protein n=1 Tax=Lactuca virosa TaxID=75947 RepID=A0AAU9LYG8_9ASTR|nr:unnamed protein product [Lactuca virosa]
MKEIGSGSYGVVWGALNEHTEEVVAIKQLKMKYNSTKECMNLTEVKALRQMDHPNIVKLKEIIKEYDSLAYMHNNSYFHRDLKPENLLVSKDVIKIADLGLVGETNQQPYTVNVGLRCVIGSPTESMLSLVNSNYQYPQLPGVQLSSLLPSASLESLNLIATLLSWSPSARPTAMKALDHPFFNTCSETEDSSDPSENLICPPPENQFYGSETEDSSEKLTGLLPENIFCGSETEDSSEDLENPFCVSKTEDP